MAEITQRMNEAFVVKIKGLRGFLFLEVDSRIFLDKDPNHDKMEKLVLCLAKYIEKDSALKVKLDRLSSDARFSEMIEVMVMGDIYQINIKYDINYEKFKITPGY